MNLPHESRSGFEPLDFVLLLGDVSFRPSTRDFLPLLRVLLLGDADASLALVLLLVLDRERSRLSRRLASFGEGVSAISGFAETGAFFSVFTSFAVTFALPFFPLSLSLSPEESDLDSNPSSVVSLVGFPRRCDLGSF